MNTSVIQLDCEYTKENLMELQTKLHKKPARICLILSILGFLAFAAGLYFAIAAMIFFGGFWGIFFAINVNRPARKKTKAKLKSDLTNYGEPVKLTLKFYNTLVTSLNHQSGHEKKLEYLDVVKVLRTRNLIMLVTEDKTALLGDLRTTDSENVEVLWERLQAQCTEAIIEYAK